MITRNEILETNSMISEMNLDVRTITMGISLLDCADADINKFNEKVYNKITTYAKDLVRVGDDLAKEYGIEMPTDELDGLAERFALERGGRSARLAKQFIEGLLSR